MVNFEIKLKEFSTNENGNEIGVPVNQIISVYECAPFHTSKKTLPLSRILIKEYGNVERSYFIQETLSNILSKIRLGFEEYIKTPDCNSDMLLSISMDELPVFDVLDDLTQKALVLIPLNKIESYRNSHKERCVICVNGHQILVDKSQLKLTEARNRIENDFVQLMRDNKVF